MTIEERVAFHEIAARAADREFIRKRRIRLLRDLCGPMGRSER